MRKQLLTSFILFLSVAVYAQQIPIRWNNEKLNFTAPEKHSLLRTSSVIDTVTVYLDRATGATIYKNQPPYYGYAFGTSYVDTFSALYPITDETGIEFDGVGDATVSDILVWFGRKEITGTPDNVIAKIYTVGADSMPLTEIASGVISTANIDTASSPVFTDITITSGNPHITSDFFVSIAYSGIDDTIGIVSSAVGNGMNEKRIRQLLNANFPGGWVRLGEFYSFVDVDIFVLPVVEIATGISEHFTSKDATLSPVYPSPADEYIHLNYTLKNNSDVSYKLFDLKGKTYLESKTQRENAGTYLKTLNISQCAAGKYFLTVTINGNPVTQKVTVVK